MQLKLNKSLTIFVTELFTVFFAALELQTITPVINLPHFTPYPFPLFIDLIKLPSAHLKTNHCSRTKNC